ncbi:MAG: energy transducer TonB [Bacteroidota bacterium]
MMITRPKLCLLFFLLAASLVGQEDNLLGLVLEEGDTGKVYKVAEQMPLFLNREEMELDSYAEMKAAADKAMLNFIYTEVKYPKEDFAAGTEGMAVVTFIVERDGRITSVETMRSVSPDIDAEALRVIDVMAWELPPWEPGHHYGEPVRTRFNLPIMFRIKGGWHQIYPRN